MNVLRKVIIDFVSLIFLAGFLCLIHVEFNKVAFTEAFAFISNPRTVLLTLFFACTLPLAHELSHKLAYKLINKNLNAEIRKEKNWSVLDQGDYWYTRVKMLFVLFAPLVVCFLVLILYAIFPTPYDQVCLAVFVGSIFIMLGDLYDAISIIRDKERFEYKYGAEGKLMRRCIWEDEYYFYG